MCFLKMDISLQMTGSGIEVNSYHCRVEGEQMQFGLSSGDLSVGKVGLQRKFGLAIYQLFEEKSLNIKMSMFLIRLMDVFNM